MNYDEIAHMVQKAEQYAEYFCESIGDTGHHHWREAYAERLAELVAAAEREACARVAEIKLVDGPRAIAAAIRARGEQK